MGPEKRKFSFKKRVCRSFFVVVDGVLGVTHRYKRIFAEGLRNEPCNEERNHSE